MRGSQPNIAAIWYAEGLPWSENDDRIVQETFKQGLSDEEISLILEPVRRSASAIAVRRKQLGLWRREGWAELRPARQQLKNLHDQGMTVKQIMDYVKTHDIGIKEASIRGTSKTNGPDDTSIVYSAMVHGGRKANPLRSYNERFLDR